MRAPLPEDAVPLISAWSIPVSPAPLIPRPIGAGHTHAGPVFAYILQGDIENQVEPDPPEIYKTGGFFYEAPGHVHRFLRNLSTSERASLIVFQAGDPGNPVPVIKQLLQDSLVVMRNQEVSLLRLTLPPGGLSETAAHSNPDMVYVLGGKIGISVSPKMYGPGDVFVVPADHDGFSLENVSSTEPAKLLVYQVTAKQVGESGAR